VNFYQMDVNEFDRYIRNNPNEVSTLARVLFEKYRDAKEDLDAFYEALQEMGFDAYPDSLITEIKEKQIDYDNLLYEYNELKKELQAIKMVAN